MESQIAAATSVSSAAASTTSVASPTKIQWAAAPGTVKTVSLEEQYEVAKARNWVSERLITQSQRHWHCTREEAIERLLAQHR